MLAFREMGPDHRAYCKSTFVGYEELYFFFPGDHQSEKYIKKRFLS